MRTLIPEITIAPGLVYRYEIWDPPYRPDPNFTVHHLRQDPPSPTYTGLLTPGTRKSLIRAINLLVAISLPKQATDFKTGKQFTFRINFITLTLPAPQLLVTDKQLIRGPLKSWLKYWRRETHGMSYVWRAERQGNGNLHFHLTTDRYILYSDIRDTWNSALASLGFIDLFESKHHHRHPNSTDVHAVAHIRNLAAYIAKYMSKQDRHVQRISGRVWDCSRNLKPKERCTIPVDAAVEDCWSSLTRRFPHQRFDSEHCSGFRLNEKQMQESIPQSLFQHYTNWLESIRNPQGLVKNATGKNVIEQ